MGTGSGSLKAALDAFHSCRHSSVMYLNSGVWRDISTTRRLGLGFQRLGVERDGMDRERERRDRGRN